MKLSILTAGFVCLLVASVTPVDLSSFGAHMDAAQVVPPTSSHGTGIISCGFRVDEFTNPRTCSFFITYEGLSSQVTGAYLMKGVVGENGAVAETLALGSFESPTFTSLDLPLDEVYLFYSDSLYAIITTVGFPDGEIRGYFVDETDFPAQGISWGRVRAIFK
jgi:hypothetical protein